MPLPAVFAAPVVWKAATILGAFAAGAVVAARRGPERVDIVTDDALDRLADGPDLRIDPNNGRIDAEARLTRTIRLGPNGPGVSVEAAGIARLRMRRVPRG